jgi:hypothetical protein
MIYGGINTLEYQQASVVQTLEEVTGLSYKEWQGNWKTKYGN